jgi:hypothetical protein
VVRILVAGPALLAAVDTEQLLRLPDRKTMVLYH